MGRFKIKTFLTTFLCLFICWRFNLVQGDDTPKVLPSEYTRLLSKISALETRVSDAESKMRTVESDAASLTSLQTKVQTLVSSLQSQLPITALQTKVETLETLVSSLQSQLPNTALQTKVETLETLVSSLQSQLPNTSLQTKVETLETLVSSLQSQLQSHQSEMNNQQVTISSLISQISSNSATMDQKGKLISSLTQDLANEKSNVAALEKKILSLETKTSNYSNVVFNKLTDISRQSMRNFSDVYSNINCLNATMESHIQDNKVSLYLLAVNTTDNRNTISALTNELLNHTDTAQRQYTTFHTDVLSLQAKQRDQEVQLKSHQSAIDLHNTMLIIQVNRTREISARLGSLERNVSDHSQRLMSQGYNISSILLHVKEIQSRNVAFYVRLPLRDITLHEGHTLVFSNVITNQGRAFSGTTGVFTCNMEGIYVFHINLVTIANDFVLAQVMKNDASMGYAEAVGTSHSDATGYNTVVLDLQIGDLVWIRAVAVGGSKTSLSLPDHLTKYITFSGYLIN